MSTRTDGNKTIIGILQDCVNAETTSRNLYWARSVFWRNVGLHRLVKYYLKQSQEDHAQRNADRMAFLGSQPKIEPTAVGIFDSENSIAGQFQVDLKVEMELAGSYSGGIKVAEDAGDYVTRKMWTKILKSTQKHIQFLKGELAQIALIGEDNYLASWIG